MKRNLKLNKTGSQQCTRAVCSTFTEIQSTVTPRCIDTLFRVRIPFQSLAQSLKSNPDSSPPFQSPVHVYTSHSPIFILGLQKRPVFLLHLALFRLVVLRNERLLNFLSLLLQDLLLLSFLLYVLAGKVLFTAGHRLA